ncbi:MAG: hypothetical protein H6Q72_2748 [Firmicutes bacterium]|nr:hypothetical protein [Bacillota bacterium]
MTFCDSCATIARCNNSLIAGVDGNDSVEYI